MLTILLLLKLDLPPAEINAEKGTDRERYITAMQEGDNGNFTLLENIISKALVEVLKKIVNK